MKNYCVTVRNTATEEQRKFKFEAGDEAEANKEKIEGVEVAKVILQERVQQRTVEQIFDMPIAVQHQAPVVPHAERC